MRWRELLMFHDATACYSKLLKPFLLLEEFATVYTTSVHSCSFCHDSKVVYVCLQLKVAQDIIAKDGAGGLYKGLSAGLLRQATYTTARLGIFQIFSDLLKQQNQGKVHCDTLQSSAAFLLHTTHCCKSPCYDCIRQALARFAGTRT